MANHNLHCPVCGGPLTLMTVTVAKPQYIANLVNTTMDHLWDVVYVHNRAKSVLCDRCEYAEEVSDLHARAAAMEGMHAQAAARPN